MFVWVSKPLSSLEYQTNLIDLFSFCRVKQLQSILVQRTFAGEDSLNCYVLTAKLLISLSSKNPYPTDINLPFTLEQYWDALVVQFKEKRALSVTESVLPLLGALLAQVKKDMSFNLMWNTHHLLWIHPLDTL